MESSRNKPGNAIGLFWLHAVGTSIRAVILTLTAPNGVLITFGSLIVKKTDIGVGRFYTDGKAGLREVLAEGPQFKLYEAVADEDCLRYKPHVSSGGIPAGTESNTTRVSFAAWAKSEVLPDAVGQWLINHQSISIAKKLSPGQRAFLATFDRDLNLTSSISCQRGEFRSAKSCREKGLIAEMPESLAKDMDHFDLIFTGLGLAVLKRVLEDPAFA
ncbi:putative transmembrane protein [Pseudomonas veronii 1YdBTEX2]|uniref:Putative transmembrane protein n=1 Tax=Pseudomonas veronii 1YdBTEX2 TaxID=1295141 RepID=A0A1D3K8I0_PSEVE|nr:putative transmembrane protein [Pseudomonas veronii 1YdBTEX2]